jgi:hypothetical protein
MNILYNNAYDNFRIGHKNSVYTSIFRKTSICNFSVVSDIRAHVGFGLGISITKESICVHVVETIEEMNNNE